MTEASSVILNKKIKFSLLRTVTKEEFIGKIVEFANSVVNFLINSGCEKIGHINFIATTDGEDYLQVNITECAERPKIKDFLRKKFNKVSTTLNIIEFGVKKEQIDNKINEEIENIEAYFNSNK
ncbi:MAG: hypothetical protein PHU65_00895 [Actinomycetota bacterium]|jgi:hypothetical protein|nr:hypothetical protein [Actinomycetota bacterium]